MYVNVFSKQSNGLYTALWAKKEIMNHLYDISSNRTVRKSLLSTKTVVQALRFRVFDKFCYVLNTSLNATSPKQRFQEIKEILETFYFGDELKLSNYE